MVARKKSKKLDLFDPSANKPFIITVSSRALFDLEESNQIFEELGEEAFAAYQREHEDVPLMPGAAFSFIKKLLEINEKLPENARQFEVILLSRNSPETGLRVFNTIEKMGLEMFRAVFTSGTSPSRYIKALGADMFLSTNPIEVKKALEQGVAAATLMPRTFSQDDTDAQIRIAFDGDAVLFSDEAEKIHHEGGLDKFRAHEIEHVERPLPSGPFRGFLEVIHELQNAFGRAKDCPIRTALVTARSMPTHKRAILTLRSWGVRVDEAMFLGGKNKGPFLEAFDADLFLDDSRQNIENTLGSCPSGHVPFGVRNAEGADDSKGSGGHTGATQASVSAQPPVSPSRSPKP